MRLLLSRGIAAGGGGIGGIRRRLIRGAKREQKIASKEENRIDVG